jgi:hypothetical protein
MCVLGGLGRRYIYLPQLLQALIPARYFQQQDTPKVCWDILMFLRVRGSHCQISPKGSSPLLEIAVTAAHVCCLRLVKKNPIISIEREISSDACLWSILKTCLVGTMEWWS